MTDTETFEVDEKIDVVVDWDDVVTYVAPSGTDYGSHFTVTNQSNSAGATWFQLTTETVASDDFNMATPIEIWEDTTGNGTPDTNLTSSPYIQIAVDEVRDIYIVADAPDNTALGTVGDQAQYHLIATAWAGDSSGAGALAEDDPGANGSNDNDEVERIWVDAQGTASVEGTDPDGIHSDVGTFEGDWGSLTVEKVAGDGAASGYHIPGDEVTYTISVSNSSGETATGITVTDDLSTLPVTYKAGSIYVTAPNLYSGSRTNLSDTTGNDEGQFASDTVTVTDIDLNDGQSATVEFTVTID